MMYKNLGIYIVFILIMFSCTNAYAQLTGVSTSVGFIMHPMSRSSIGMNQVVNQTAPVHDIAIGFNVFKSPFKFRFRVAYTNSEFIAYKSDPFYNTDSSEGLLLGYSLEKVLPIYTFKKHTISASTGLAFFVNSIKADNQDFTVEIIALTEPNFGKFVEVQSNPFKFSNNLFLTNSLNYTYNFWRKMNLGLYAQFDYGFGDSADYYLNQTILRSPGSMDIERNNDTIQKFTLLRNYLSFGFSLGVGL